MRGGRLEHPPHRLADPAQSGQRLRPAGGRGAVLGQQVEPGLAVHQVVFHQPLECLGWGVQVIVRDGPEIERVHEIQAGLKPRQVARHHGHQGRRTCYRIVHL